MNINSLWSPVLDMLSDPVCLLDADFRILRCNTAMKSLFHISDEEIYNKPCWTIIHHRTDPYPDCPVSRMMKSLKRESGVMQIGDKWYEITADPILDADGVLTQTIHTMRDISDRKMYENELEQGIERFRSMIDTAPYGAHLYELRSDGRLIFIGTNKSADSILGVNNTQFIGMTIEEAFPNLIPTEIPAEYKKTASLGVSYNNEQVIYSDDKGISGAFEVCAFQTAPYRIAALFRDITEKKKAEEALKESEIRYQELVQTLPLGIFETDPQGRIVFINSTAMKWLGYNEDDIAAGLHATDLVSGFDCPRVAENLARSLTSKEPIPNEYTACRKNRDTFQVLVISRPYFTSGRLSGYRGIVIDISERKKAEQEIFLERQRLAVTLRSIGDGVITTETKGNIVFLNPVAEELTGFSNQEASGRPLPEIYRIIDEHTRKPCENPVEKVLKSDRIVELSNHTILISRNGTEHMIEDSGSPIRDEKGNTYGVILVFRDVTEKRKMLETVQQIQRLNSLGILAGGIAHDFNNLLTGIFGYIDLARLKSNFGMDTSNYLSSAMEVLSRARGLTQQLLTFSKGGMPVRKSGNIEKAVRDCVSFVLSGSNIRCEFMVEENLNQIEFDETQFSQVIDNIIINAQQAMPMGGIIFISIGSFHLGETSHRILKPGDYLKISVKDSGIGIPGEILPRIFDPFFTTKTKGHGLGLATAYSIMRKHDGFIDVESEPGKGSVFHIYLPFIKTTGFPVAEEYQGLYKGSGRILIMDDEAFIRDTLSAMLLILGFETVCVKDGIEALTCIANEKLANRTFSAIFLDLTIPGSMSGKDVAASIRKTDTSIPIIVASGYSEDPIIAHPGDYGFTASIAKPFTIKDLSTILMKVLNA